MIPVVTPAEMAQVDAAAPQSRDELIGRAGWAVASAAVRMLGGTYGRRIVMVAGKGSNGADGRVAAGRLRAAGARVTVVEATPPPPVSLRAADLVIDAAYGTGFRGSYAAPDLGSAPVLSVDIPSGLDALTGEAGDDAVRAAVTVTFAALKPGLLLGAGPMRAGAVALVDLGLDVSSPRAHLVEDVDVDAWVPGRPRSGHKWQTAVAVVAGSPGMLGAPLFVAHGAMRAGAGYVRLAVPGGAPDDLPAGEEAVAVRLPCTGWLSQLGPELERVKALVVGPGLGRGDEVGAEVRALVAAAAVPVVIDADGLGALGRSAEEVLAARTAATVLTPHDGEFAGLTGANPGADRLAAVRDLARRTGAVVLLKGSTTVVAGPDGRVLLAASGSARLATAGTGDVLSGVVGALLARGVPALEAAALAAHIHGRAASLGHATGLVAGDLPALVATWLSGRPAGG